jgi:hypothetical protein
MLQKTAQSAKFGEDRHVEFRGYPLTEQTFSHIGRKGETADGEFLNSTGIFSFREPEAYTPRLWFSLFDLPVAFSFRQHRSPVFDCMGGLLAN